MLVGVKREHVAVVAEVVGDPVRLVGVVVVSGFRCVGVGVIDGVDVVVGSSVVRAVARRRCMCMKERRWRAWVRFNALLDESCVR